MLARVAWSPVRRRPAAVAPHVRWRTGGRLSQRALAPVGSIPGDEKLRAAHREQMAAVADSIDADVLETIKLMGLGRFKGTNKANRQESRRGMLTCSAHKVGMVISAGDPLPQVKASQVEVALIGRSNAGKSALVNALTGARAHEGAASVHARPGWTTSIQFFEMREIGTHPHEDAAMTLVDLPGYGPAVANAAAKALWRRATRRYLRDRPQLACAFVLIDASLGLTPDDRSFLDFLDGARGGGAPLPYHGVLTKCDLLEPLELAQSYELIERELRDRAGYAGGDMPICSAKNSAGVAELWRRLREGVRALAASRAEGEFAMGNGDEDGDDSHHEATMEETQGGDSVGSRRRRGRRRRSATGSTSTSRAKVRTRSASATRTP
jgi:GTP-binding protein